MSFNPKSEYTIVPTEFSIKDFHEYKEDYVTRPPYQRKAVWPKKKKQSLMDSLFRGITFQNWLCAKYDYLTTGQLMKS